MFSGTVNPPFTFVLGGKSSDDLLRYWKRTDTARKPDAERLERTLSWTDEESGLQVRLIGTEYAEFPVVE